MQRGFRGVIGTTDFGIDTIFFSTQVRIRVHRCKSWFDFVDVLHEASSYAGQHPIGVIMDNKFFFDRYGLAQADVERYLSAALSAGGDYADLYFEYQTSTSVSLDESMVKSASQGISVGCGVRVLAGERTGYAYTDDLSPQRILHAARTAALIASGPAKQPVVGLTDAAARLVSRAAAFRRSEVLRRLTGATRRQGSVA